jgi:antitoxin component YwqK of YwqJK toxin-antitoxin module
MHDLNIAEIPYDTGEIRFRYSRYLASDGSKWIRHGPFASYYKTGSVASEGSYQHGAEHGAWRDFHENGQVAAEGSYELGVESGEWKYWAEDGTPQAGV